MLKERDAQFYERQAAEVCVLFRGRQFEDAEVLLTLRTSIVATHAGQVAFPGGGVEPTDTQIGVAALRECEEEVGLPMHHLEIVGNLPVYPTLGGPFLVTPVVTHFNAADSVPFRLQHQEVEQASWVSVAQLKASFEVETRELFGESVATPVFWWGAHRMWGLSAWIFDSILNRYANLKP